MSSRRLAGASGIYNTNGRVVTCSLAKYLSCDPISLTDVGKRVARRRERNIMDPSSVGSPKVSTDGTER